MIGAGFSSAFGLPNTHELLRKVHELASKHHLAVEGQLKEAYRYFYPERSKSFIPDVVDFFSVLRAYEDVASGLPGGFVYPGLLGELKLAIVRLLCEAVREKAIPTGGWPEVEEILTPGNVVITSNWDTFIEWYALCRSIPLRLGEESGPGLVTLVKLHGSVDWVAKDNRKKGTTGAVPLRQLQNTARPYSLGIGAADLALRIKSLENMKRNWQFIKARTSQPLMVVMSQGKTKDLEPIRSMWHDAYRALGRSKNVHIIGYSMPPDDIEIRALLRAGATRGAKHAELTVTNPDPGVHVRVRTYISQDMKADYRPFTV